MKIIPSLILAAALLTPVAAHAQTVDGPTISPNWAGYISWGAATGIYSNIRVPADENPSSYGDVAAWIGIGGSLTDDLIQAGVSLHVAKDGTTSTFAWYELLPQPPVVVPLQVNPGDTVYVSISEDCSTPAFAALACRSNWWNLKITNGAGTFEKRVFYRSSNKEAEWVMEPPMDSSTGCVMPLTGHFDNLQWGAVPQCPA